jgi:Predicted membrane protein (DUF2306)
VSPRLRRLHSTRPASEAFGLGGLALAWMLTTGMALIAIRRSLVDQHKEWMIRSYVVTFGFVTFRGIIPLLRAAGVEGEA